MATDFLGKIITEVQTLALGTQADQDALAMSQLTLSEDFRILKTEVQGIVVDFDDSPPIVGLMLGIANGELSNTEIAQAVTAQGPLDRNDRTAAERASRFVKIVGAAVPVPVHVSSSATKQNCYFAGKDGGPIITFNPRWTFSDPEGWVWFIFNNTGSAMVTGATARLIAKHFGVWVT